MQMLPLNFGDLDGEQQANTLFNKVRLIRDAPHHPIAPRAAAFTPRASCLHGKAEASMSRHFFIGHFTRALPAHCQH
jgi:hypothetical protein